MARAIARLVPLVRQRSLGRCEAVWHIGYRCPNPADEIQHRLPRARARKGDEHLLDLAGDVDNLAHLCKPCHDAAHASTERAVEAFCVGEWGSMHPDDLRKGLVVAGSVVSGLDGRPVYTGPHPAYQDRYPQEPAA